VRESGWSIPRAFLKSSHCEAAQRTSVIVNFPSERPRSVMVAPFLPGDFFTSIACSTPGPVTFASPGKTTPATSTTSQAPNCGVGSAPAVPQAEDPNTGL